MRKRDSKLFCVSAVTRKETRLRLLFHCIGLSTLGSALFLQGLVLTSIIENGYFRGIEQNPFILYSEVLLMAFGIAYCVFLVWHFVFLQLARRSN